MDRRKAIKESHKKNHYISYRTIKFLPTNKKTRKEYFLVKKINFVATDGGNNQLVSIRAESKIRCKNHVIYSNDQTILSLCNIVNKKKKKKFERFTSYGKRNTLDSSTKLTHFNTYSGIFLF